MKYLIVLLLCILSTTKMTVHSAFSKKSVRTQTDVVFFTFLIFCAIALLFSPALVDASAAVWLYGAIFGVCSMGFQFFYTQALATGNVSITVLVVNFALLIPVLVSALVYQEPLSWIRLTGIVLTFASFFLSTEFRSRNPIQGKWIGFVLLTFLFNGGCGVAQKLFGKSPVAKESFAFVACAYLTAAVGTGLVYLILRLKKQRCTYPIRPKVFGYALAIGAVLAVFQLLNTYAVATVDGTFLFPAYSGGSTLFSAAVGLLLFHDRYRKRQWAGLAMGVVAIVLMNF